MLGYVLEVAFVHEGIIGSVDVNVKTATRSMSGRDHEPGPLASVVVLGFNGLVYLEDCLSSVLDQDLPRDSYEVLYADNGSTDGSVAFVRQRFPDVQVAALDRNYGYAEGNNIALKRTSGEFVVFLNQDTVVNRSWLRSLIDAIGSDPQVAAGHANIIQPWYEEFSGIDRRADVAAAYTAEVNRLGFIHYERLPSADQLVDTIFLHGVCIVIVRSLAVELGYVFHPDFFAYAEDLDLGLRIHALGYRSVVVPGAIVYHKHALQTKPTWATVAKTIRIIRNRYLAFFKVMSAWEFALMVPLLTIGAPLNAAEFGLSRARRLLYGVALVPATLVALAVTLLQLRHYAGKRRQVRTTMREQSSWCLRTLWGAAAERQP